MNKDELIKECLTEQIKIRDEQINELNEEIGKLMAENDNMERTLKIKQNHILTEEIKRLNNIINTIQQEMENLNDTGIFSIKPKYVWQRIEILKGVDKE